MNPLPAASGGDEKSKLFPYDAYRSKSAPFGKRTGLSAHILILLRRLLS